MKQFDGVQKILHSHKSPELGNLYELLCDLNKKIAKDNILEPNYSNLETVWGFLKDIKFRYKEKETDHEVNSKTRKIDNICQLFEKMRARVQLDSQNQSKVIFQEEVEKELKTKIDPTPLKEGQVDPKVMGASIIQNLVEDMEYLKLAGFGISEIEAYLIQVRKQKKFTKLLRLSLELLYLTI